MTARKAGCHCRLPDGAARDRSGSAKHFQQIMHNPKQKRAFLRQTSTAPHQIPVHRRDFTRTTCRNLCSLRKVEAVITTFNLTAAAGAHLPESKLAPVNTPLSRLSYLVFYCAFLTFCAHAAMAQAQLNTEALAAPLSFFAIGKQYFHSAEETLLQHVLHQMQELATCLPAPFSALTVFLTDCSTSHGVAMQPHHQQLPRTLLRK